MRPAITLVEAIITIVVTAIIALVVASFISEGISAWDVSATRKNFVIAARAALYRIDRELKLYPATNITTFGASALTVNDLNNNPVTFSQQGSNLLRNGDVLLDNLAQPGGLSFTYLNSNESGTTDIPEIKAVRTQLKVVKNGSQFVIQSAARFRLGNL